MLPISACERFPQIIPSHVIARWTLRVRLKNWNENWKKRGEKAYLNTDMKNIQGRSASSLHLFMFIAFAFRCEMLNIDCMLGVIKLAFQLPFAIILMGWNSYWEREFAYETSFCVLLPKTICVVEHQLSITDLHIFHSTESHNERTMTLLSYSGVKAMKPLRLGHWTCCVSIIINSALGWVIWIWFEVTEGLNVTADVLSGLEMM